MRIQPLVMLVALLASCGSSSDSASDAHGADSKKYSLDMSAATSDSIAMPSDVSAGAGAAFGVDAVTTTGPLGCSSKEDQAFLAGLAKDATAAADFAQQVKNCALPNVNLPDDASTAAQIAKCVAGSAKGVSADCGGCFGMQTYCTFVHCVADPQEALVANCAGDPTSTTCEACTAKHGCTAVAEACKAGPISKADK